VAEPRNFDEIYNGQRQFTIGGQTFHWRPLHWREWGEILDNDAAREAAEQREREAKIAELVKSGIEEFAAENQVDDEQTTVEAFGRLVDRCAVYLEPSEIQSFKDVMQDTTKPISYAMVTDLLVWLQGVQTPDRPTETPTPSSSGPGTQGVTSPAA
jgi:hypothetical protein